MALPPSLPSQTPAKRPPFLTRAEFATLLGMILVVFSLFLAWERPPLHAPLPQPSLYMEMKPRTGLGSPVMWPLLICAVLCGATLLWTPSEKTRLPISAVQGAGGLACLVIALTRLSLLPGLLVGLVGAALLVFGAIDRFSTATGPPG